MPPTGREDVSVSSPPDVAVTAPAGSSSRDSAATRRLTAVAVDLVLAAEGMQDLGARDPGLSVPLVVGQLQVPDDLPVLGLARRRLQVHDVEASRSPTSRSNYLPRSTQCNYLIRVTRRFYSLPLVATR